MSNERTGIERFTWKFVVTVDCDAKVIALDADEAPPELNISDEDGRELMRIVMRSLGIEPFPPGEPTLQ